MNVTPPSPRLSLSLLGEWQLTLDGAPVKGRLYGKVIAVLAYLATQSERAHGREQLAALLWPGLAATSARNNLRQTLRYLRQALGEYAVRLLQTRRDTVRFLGSHPDCLFDVKTLTIPPPPCGRCSGAASSLPCAECLNANEARLAVYRGEFLAGLSVNDAPEFESWLESQRQRLRQQAVRLAEKLCAAYEAAGKLERALAHAQRCLQIEPWNEAAHRRYMRLLASQGQYATAQTHYDAYHAALFRDLNTEPDDSTRALFEATHRPGSPIRNESSPEVQALPPPPKAERRQVTVLCCHLDISSGLTAEISERLAESRLICAVVLRRYAGHVAQGHDGYLYAYMGYPQASELSGKQAVQAAMELEACFGPPNRVRIGIHTGMVISGFDPAMPDCVGAVSAMAWRLCRQMRSSGIAISDTTAEMLHGKFPELTRRPLGRIGTGRGQPAHPAYRLVSATAGTGRPSPPLNAGKLVGRRTEMQRLKRLWRLAAQGAPQFIVLRGTAGIGKTRLVRALHDEISGRPARVRVLHCYPEYRHTPLYPVIALIEAVIGVTPEDTPADQRDKLRKYLAHHHPDMAAEAELVLQRLLSIAPPGTPMPAPRQRRQQTLDMMLMLVDSLATDHPLLLVIEDAHWLDVTSLDLLERLLHRKKPAALLTLITARETFQPGWLERDAVLDLQPLGHSDIGRLAQAAVGRIPQHTLERIVERAEGIPLYAEEMARILPHRPEDCDDIPVSLQYMLLARLDAVPRARRLIQMAATLGRQFEIGLLQRVAGVDSVALESTLQQLVEARLIVPVGLSHDFFRFHHALIHEAAYESQIQADRQDAHRQAANVLLRHYAARANQHPGEVARHYTGAGDMQAAIPWWLRAGRQALRVSANAEARKHLLDGLNLIGKLPPGDERDTLELELLLTLGQALLLLHGYGSPEAAEVYDRAHALAHDGLPATLRFEILWGQWMVSSSRAGFDESWRLAQQLLQLARMSDDEKLLVQACSANANIALWRNRLTDACHYALAALDLPEVAPHDTLEGLNPHVTSLAYLSWIHWRQGNIREAQAFSDHALALADAQDSPDSRCYALGFAGMLQRFLGNMPAAAAHAREIEKIAQVHQLVFWQGVGSMLAAVVRVHEGDESGLTILQVCVEGVKQAMPSIAGVFLHALAEACFVLGRYEAQLHAIDEGLEASARAGEEFFHGLLWQMRRDCPAAEIADGASSSETPF